MKKIATLLIMGVLIVANATVGFAADSYNELAKNPINIMVDGVEISSFDNEQGVDLPAVIVNGRTMMPLKRTFDLFEVGVQWNGTDKSITATTPQGQEVWLQINNTTASVGGVTVVLDAAPIIFEGRTFVPLAFVSEAMGVAPSWDGVNRTVMLNLSGLRGIALPATIKGAYLDTYEADIKTNFYYHRTKLYKSVVIEEKNTSVTEVAAQVAEGLNLEIELFRTIESPEALAITYDHSSGVQIQHFVFEKSGKVYSAEFKDFAYDEAVNVLKDMQ